MKDRKISAGSYDLNKFLFGGYETDIITTIYGPGGSGKTNFCILVAVSQAKKGNKVIYIDTEGGFSSDRVKQIAGEETEKVLENIFLLKPTSFEEQEDAFEQLLKYVNPKQQKEAKNEQAEGELQQNQASSKSGSVSLIVIDSIAMLYRLELGDAIQSKDDEKIKEVNRNLAGQLKELNEIARKQQIPVIITNQVYSEFLTDEDFRAGKTRGVSMVGGDLLKYWSKCIMELKNDRGKRTLVLKKHRSMPEKELGFEIISSGIRKRGWI